MGLSVCERMKLLTGPECFYRLGLFQCMLGKDEETDHFRCKGYRESAL